MAKREIDGVIKDWGERADYGRVQGRKGKNIAGGRYSKPAPTKRPAGREKLAATVRKAPEVMVKISGGGKDMRSIKAHMDYISRNGAVELEDEQGRVHQGKEDVRAVRDDWRGGGIPYEDGKKREAFNIVLSMPPGTDRASVKNAARAFAAELFGNHQYVFAAHDDEKHPHVHLAVKAVDLDGVRLNPRKADLQHWRETFAEKLREQGIEANATPRKVRGVVQKAEKQAVRHIDREHARGRRKAPARVSASQREAAELEARAGRKHVNPAHDNIIAQRKSVQHDFGTVARALATGDQDDKRLAVEVVQFVKQMPPIKTRHAEQVEALQRATVQQGGQGVEQTQQPGKPSPEQGRAEDKGRGR
ncbi:relaxase/mobilization nuclease domain-containing protein [Bordetella avium]